MGLDDFHVRFNATGRVGAKCRVLETGAIAAGDEVVVESRPAHDVTVTRVATGMTGDQARGLLDSGLVLVSQGAQPRDSGPPSGAEGPLVVPSLNLSAFLGRQVQIPGHRGIQAPHMKRLSTGSGACRISVPSGAQGRVGTRADAFSFSIASTIARTPFSVETIIGIRAPAFISEAM